MSQHKTIHHIQRNASSRLHWKIEKSERPFRLTPYIATFAVGAVTDIDMKNILEAGLRVVRFRMSYVAKTDNVELLACLKKAIACCYEKHDRSYWPVAVSIDLPNAGIMTGYLKDEINANSVRLKQNSIVEVTTDVYYWNKCDAKRVFIDDRYTFPTITPNAEISIAYGVIVMICVEVVNEKCIKCRVDIEGDLQNAQFVCIRGVKLRKPPVTKLDRQLIEFAKENEVDMVSIHSIRDPSTVTRVRGYFKDCRLKPFIMSTICEQEGLNRLDEIIDVSDGLCLAREFIAVSITNPSRMWAIQMYAGAKCRQAGKPFYISGRILESTLKSGTWTCNEISDVTNAVLQGAGLLLRTNYSSPANLVTTMEVLNELCHEAEQNALKGCFWSLVMQKPAPINAAEATILACAVAAKQTGTTVVIVLSVTGWSAIKLSYLAPHTIIITVSTDEVVPRRLQLYRGIIPLVYGGRSKKEDWYDDMNRRIQFAVDFGLSQDILQYNHTYMVLRKGTPGSAFCDQISTWKVVNEKTVKHRATCPGHTTESVSRLHPGRVIAKDIIYAPLPN